MSTSQVAQNRSCAKLVAMNLPFLSQMLTLSCGPNNLAAISIVRGIYAYPVYLYLDFNIQLLDWTLQPYIHPAQLSTNQHLWKEFSWGVASWVCTSTCSASGWSALAVSQSHFWSLRWPGPQTPGFFSSTEIPWKLAQITRFDQKKYL